VFEHEPIILASNREYVGFAQDRWLVRPNLSLDLGLRYETSVSPTNRTWLRVQALRGRLRKRSDGCSRGIGLFYDKVPLNIRSFSRYPGRTVTRYGTDGLTVTERHRFRNVLVDTAPILPLDFRHSNIEAGFVPKNLTWNIQL